jgi:hypothetical protein
MADTFTAPAQLTEEGPRSEVDNDPRADIPDEWGRQSFPASDPPQNW